MLVYLFSVVPLPCVCVYALSEEEVYECECLLNATGRVPNVFGVGLDEAGVDYNNRQGVVIDDYFKWVCLRAVPSRTVSCFRGICCPPGVG